MLALSGEMQPASITHVEPIEKFQMGSLSFPIAHERLSRIENSASGKIPMAAKLCLPSLMLHLHEHGGIGILHPARLFAFLVSDDPVLQPQSHYARSISQLSYGLLYVSLGIFLLVTILVFYAAWKFRATPGEPEPKQVFGSIRWETLYLAFPIVILTVVFIFTLRVMHASDPPAQPSGDDIVIVGHQWWWEVRYPKLGFTTANEIHIPANQNIQFGLESSDVIHDFWVPELGRKEDLIPGRHGKIWLAAEHPGTYLGACAEFCGKEHAWMRIRVIADDPATYSAWVTQEQQHASTPVATEAQMGHDAVMSYPCASCHTIAGTTAQGKVGPDLTHVASRETLAAGRLPNTPSNLSAWLHDPDQFKPGSHMPNLQLTDEQRDRIVAYLETLK
jgi:cytochrome c oxidase subunit 2